MDNPVRIPFIAANIPGDRGGSYAVGSQGSSYQSNFSTGNYNTNPRLFEASPNGIRVTQSGTYLVTSHVKVNEKNQADTFALGVNGNVRNVNGNNTFSTDGSGNQITDITTQLKLNAGDEVSLNLVSPGTAQLIAWTSTGANTYANSMLAGYGGGAGGGGAGLTEVAGSPSIGMSMVKIA
jgi:hypothetical protein